MAAIDGEVARRSTSRSALLAEATRRELQRRDPEKVAAALARAEARFEHAGAFESADLIRRPGRQALTRLLVDSSVIIKWCHSEGESEPAAARALRAAHLR